MFSSKLHDLQHGLDQSEDRFRDLIFVQAVDVQSIAATGGHLIVDGHTQSITPEELLEALHGIIMRANFLRNMECIQAC